MNNKFGKIVLSQVILILFFLFLTSCAMFEDSSEKEDVKTEEQNSENKTSPDYNVEVFIECGENNLGAFTIEIEFNPKIVHIKSVNPASTAENLITNQTDYSTGKIKIMGYFTSESKQTGKIKVCAIEFLPVSKGTSSFKTNIINIYNLDSKPIEGRVILSKDTLEIIR